jgi:hypothetical protein
MPLLGKLVDVEKHRAQGGEMRQRALAAMLGQQQQNRTQHGRKRDVFFVNDAQRGVVHSLLLEVGRAMQCEYRASSRVNRT